MRRGILLEEALGSLDTSEPEWSELSDVDDLDP